MQASLVACVSSIILGYDIGVMSGALLSMKEDLRLSTWQALTPIKYPDKTKVNLSV